MAKAYVSTLPLARQTDDPDVLEVTLTKGYTTFIHAGDLPLISGYKWKYMNCGGYAARNKCVKGKWTTILMHRLIANAPENSEVDHWNGKRLDNRRSNLRVTDRFGNQKNQQKQKRGTSQYKGATLMKNGRWYAQIKTSQRHIHIGNFKREEDAASAYDIFARHYFGEFAALNFPMDGEMSALGFND